MKKYTKEIENAIVDIANMVFVTTKNTTIGILQKWYSNGKLIVLPKWLQRKLREYDWFKNDFLNAKQFVASIWKNTNCFDSFSVLNLEKLLFIISEKLTVEQDNEKLKELQKLFNYLNDYKAKGAVYVSMDGQSRLILGIHQYMTDKFDLNKCGVFVDLRLNGKQSNLLTTTKFNDLPINIRNKFTERNVPINIVTDFADLDDVTESLINKQKGIEWTWFQKLKQSRRWSLFYIGLDEILEKNNLFETNYETHMTVSSDYKFDVDGHELYLVNMAYMYQFGHWPTIKEIEEIFTDTKKINDTSYERVIEYSNEYFESLGKVNKSNTKKPKVTKTAITPLINYILFRQLMDGKIGTSKFAKEIKISDLYQMKNSPKFVDSFIKNHERLASTEIKHPASYIYDSTSNVWIKNQEGYKASCGKQDDVNIFRRMQFFIENFDLNELENKQFIKKVENTNMPSQTAVAIHNDWKDINGNDIFISDLKELDMSHYDASANNGSNELTNLGLEHFTPNRSRQDKNLEKI
jgi:hypothetical protein